MSEEEPTLQEQLTKADDTVVQLEGLLLSLKIISDRTIKSLAEGDINSAMITLNGLGTALSSFAMQYVYMSTGIQRCGQCGGTAMKFVQHVIAKGAKPLYAVQCVKCSWESDKFSPEAKVLKPKLEIVRDPASSETQKGR